MKIHNKTKKKNIAKNNNNNNNNKSYNFENLNAILNTIQLPKDYEITTDEYTYNVKIEYGEECDIINLIQQNNSFMECIVLSVPRTGSIADLLNVNYYSQCSRNFQKGTGTVHMVNTLLQYTLDNYPHIRTFQLKDTTNINIEIDESVKIPFYVTTRRLLKGELGWYEEKFGAEPVNNTIEIVRFLREDRALFQSVIPTSPTPSSDWWTEENVSTLIKKICMKTNKIKPGTLQTIIYFTEWTIPSKNVKHIPYKIREIKSGGGHINTILKNMKSMRMPLRRNRMQNVE